MEKMLGLTRRKFLQVSAGAAAGAAFGVGKESKAQEKPKINPEKETEIDWEQKIDRILQEELFWINSPEYANAEIVDGEEQIQEKVESIFEKLDPPAYIFGEDHDNPTCEDFFFDVLNRDSQATAVAEEALNHPLEEETNKGLLENTSSSGWKKGYSQKIEKLLKDKKLTRVLLQHPYDASIEAPTKITPFTKEGRVHILVGSYHSFLAPGATPLKKTKAYQKKKERQTKKLQTGDATKIKKAKIDVLNTTQKKHYYDELKETGAVAINFLNIKERLKNVSSSLLEELVPAIRTGKLSLPQTIELLKRKLEEYTKQLPQETRRLIWQEENSKSGFGLLLDGLDYADFNLKPNLIEPFLSFPPLKAYLEDSQYEFNVTGVSLSFTESDGTITTFKMISPFPNLTIIMVRTGTKRSDGWFVLKKTETFQVKQEGNRWDYQKSPFDKQ